MGDALERHKRMARHLAFVRLMTWAARIGLALCGVLAIVRGAHWLLVGGAFFILISWAKPGPDSDL
jgi:lysylphosphatidylglycerol synthetase-like protein (DUF2156 family)